MDLLRGAQQGRPTRPLVDADFSRARQARNERRDVNEPRDLAAPASRGPAAQIWAMTSRARGRVSVAES